MTVTKEQELWGLERHVQQQQRLDQVRTLVPLLHSRDWEVFALRHMMGFTLRELAEHYGVCTTVIAYGQQRALRHLRRYLRIRYGHKRLFW